MSLGAQQLVHADGEVAPRRRERRAAEEAEHEQAHERPVRRRHCVRLDLHESRWWPAGLLSRDPIRSLNWPASQD